MLRVNDGHSVRRPHGTCICPADVERLKCASPGSHDKHWQQQIIHNHYKKLLPVLSMASLAGGLGWLLLVRSQWSTLQFWLLASAVVAIVIAASLTVRVNFPINDQLITWIAPAPPDNIRGISSPWDNARTVSTI